MRHEVRYNNQIWHVFDTHAYMAVEAYRSESAAFLRACALDD